MKRSAGLASEVSQELAANGGRYNEQIDEMLRIELERGGEEMGTVEDLARASGRDQLLLKPRGGDAFEVPKRLAGASFDVFRELCGSAFARLDGEGVDKLLDRLAQGAPGVASLPRNEKLRLITAIFAGEKVDFSEPLRQFFSKLRQGQLDANFEREASLLGRINSMRYASAIAANFERATRVAQKRRTAEARPAEGLTGISTLEAAAFDLSSQTTFDSQAEDDGDSQSVTDSAERAAKKGNKKNLLSVTKATAEELKEFHRQEEERYKNPTKPFEYTLRFGEMRKVAPVWKKGDGSTKAREHTLLKTDRPPCVTLLSLVRDAAAKLPRGFGTRNDICELLKESQYIKPDMPDENLSAVVSGALDRLHYESDPCVKFDSHKKLWIYLHIGKKDHDFGDGNPEKTASQKGKRVKTE